VGSGRGGISKLGAGEPLGYEILEKKTRGKSVMRLLCVCVLYSHVIILNYHSL